MTDKCKCQFCIDYKRLFEVLPLIPEEHREWVEGICDRLWTIDEELNYKKAILDGSWPNAVEILEARLANAKAIRDAKAPKPEEKKPDYDEEVDEDPWKMGDNQGNFF